MEQPQQELPKDKSLATENPQHIISMKEIKDLLDQSGLSEADFEQPWELQASIYRQLIWELANSFVDTKPGWSTELTHSEYVRDPQTREVTTLDLCMEFTEDKGDEWEQKSYKAFREFLEENPLAIPEELRKKFNVYIGFNYGDQGGLLITEKDIKSITQEVLNAIESDGQIGYARDTKKENKFTISLRNKLRSESP